jgi:hypothetical protein
MSRMKEIYEEMQEKKLLRFSIEHDNWIVAGLDPNYFENTYIRIEATREVTFLTKLDEYLSPVYLNEANEYDKEQQVYSFEILDPNHDKIPIFLDFKTEKEKKTFFKTFGYQYFQRTEVPTFFCLTLQKADLYIDTSDGKKYFLHDTKNPHIEPILILENGREYFDNLEKVAKWYFAKNKVNTHDTGFSLAVQVKNVLTDLDKNTNFKISLTNSSTEEIEIFNTSEKPVWIYAAHLRADFSIDPHALNNAYYNLLSQGKSILIKNLEFDPKAYPLKANIESYVEYIKILVTTDKNINLRDFDQGEVSKDREIVQAIQSFNTFDWQMFDIQLNVKIEETNTIISDEVFKGIKNSIEKINFLRKEQHDLKKELIYLDSKIEKTNQHIISLSEEHNTLSEKLKSLPRRSATFLKVLSSKRMEVIKQLEKEKTKKEANLKYETTIKKRLKKVEKHILKLEKDSILPTPPTTSETWSKTTETVEPSAMLRYRKDRNEHLLLAMFAAFPVYITADLLYRLWQHFGKNYNVPRVAVSDLLLSNILEESSTEMFEYEPALREQLLQSLKEYFTALGKPDILKDLAVFMLDYLAAKYNKNIPYTEPVREMEEWNAMAYYDPAAANQQLAQALNPSTENNYKIRQLRAAIVTASLDNSLRSLDTNVQTDFGNVLQFSKGIRAFVSNKYEKTYEELQKVKGIQFQEVAESNSAYTVNVPIPKKVVPSNILKQSLGRTTPKLFISSDLENQDISTLYTMLDALKKLLKTDSFQVLNNIGRNFFAEGWLDSLDMKEGDTFLFYSNKTFGISDMLPRLIDREVKIIAISEAAAHKGYQTLHGEKAKNMIALFASQDQEGKTIKYKNRSVGLFTQKFIEVLTQAENALTYSELFNRIYSKVTQQTGKQQPKIEYYGEAKSDDIFLDGFLNTVPPQNQQAAKMSVGFGNDVPKEFIDIAIDIFKKEGESLFFDLVTDNENLDYIIQKIGENEYTLQTSVGEDITFPSFEFRLPTYLTDNTGAILVDNNNSPLATVGDTSYKLITIFNNIDRVANWQYTLNLHSSVNSTLSDKDVDVTFSITDFDKNISIDEPINLVIGGNRVKARFNFNTNIEGVIYLGLVYLGKDFEVNNQILQQIKIGENPTNLSKGANWDYPQPFLNKGITNVTEYVKVLISRTLFETESLNRGALREKEEVTRSIGSRSELTDYNFHQNDILVKTIILNLTWFDVMKESAKILSDQVKNPLRSILDLGAAEWDDMSTEDKYRYIVELEKEHTLLFWIKEYEYYYTKINSEPIRIQRIRQSLESLTQDCPYGDIVTILQNVRAKYFEIPIEEIIKKDSDFVTLRGNLKMEMSNYKQQAIAILGKLRKESTLRFILDFNSAEFEDFDLSKKGELLSLGVDDSNILSKKYETIEKLNEYRPLIFWINDYRFYYLYQTKMKHVIEGILFTLGILGKNCTNEKLKQILIETKKQYILDHNIKSIKNNNKSNSYSIKEYFENWIG